MHTRFPLIRSLTLALLLACTGARADVTEDIVPLQQKWAEIRYQMPENERAKVSRRWPLRPRRSLPPIRARPKP